MAVRLRYDTPTRTPIRLGHEDDGAIVPAVALSYGLGADQMIVH